MTSQIRFLSGVLFTGSVLVWTGLHTQAHAVSDGSVSESEATVRQTAIAQNSARQRYTVLHVNATAGSDVGGDGSQLKPLQTITQALRMAEPGTLILLANGVYSADNGEHFPLQMRTGVTIQGAGGPDTTRVLIHGNGNFYSPSMGLRNVTLLGADNAGLASVTVSNPHPEGIGVWIEAESPIIQENAFLENGFAGIFIAGSGSPTIRNNYFSANGKAGLVIAGPSSAQVQYNVFENTGTGITIAPEATPQIVENRVTGNLDGLIVHADARPVLQNNHISRNRRNSIIDYAPWSYTLMSPSAQASQPPPPTASPATVAVQEPPASPTPPPTVAAQQTTEPATGVDSPEVPDAIASSTADPSTSETAATAATDPPISDLPVLQDTSPAIAPVSPSEDAPEPSAPPAPELAAVEAALPADSSAGQPDVNPGVDTAAVPVPETELESSAAAGEAASANVAPAAPPVEPPVAVLASLGSDIATDVSQTVEALARVDIDIVPTIPSVAVFSDLDLAPVLAIADTRPDFIADEATEADDMTADAPDEATPAGADATPIPSDADIEASLNPDARFDTLTEQDQPESDQLQLAVQDLPDAVEIPVIPPPVDSELASPSATQSSDLQPEPAASLAADAPTDSDLPDLPPLTEPQLDAANVPLQVPGSDIPMGSGGSLPEVFTAGAAAGPAEGPPPPPSLAASLNLSYKVLVEADSRPLQNRVREQVPDAFRVRFNGRMFMQVGAYPTFEEAQAQAERLNQVGLQAQIEQIQ